MSTMTARHVVTDSPIGPLTLVRDDDGLTGLYYPGHWTNPDAAGFGPRVEPTVDHTFAEAIEQLLEYFAGQRQDFDLPLNPLGSQRARTLWQLLSQIPYGQTTTYGALARRIRDGISPRAVGGLVGHNPLSIVIPCHRVLGSTGKLTGYAGSLDRKQYLLGLETAIPVAPQTLW